MAASTIVPVGPPIFNSKKLDPLIATSQRNQKQGYNVVLSSNAKQGLQCPECDFILKEAVQTGDGIRLCEPCYEHIARYLHGKDAYFMVFKCFSSILGYRMVRV